MAAPACCVDFTAHGRPTPRVLTLPCRPSKRGDPHNHQVPQPGCGRAAPHTSHPHTLGSPRKVLRGVSSLRRRDPPPITDKVQGQIVGQSQHRVDSQPRQLGCCFRKRYRARVLNLNIYNKALQMQSSFFVKEKDMLVRLWAQIRSGLTPKC
jgi:hypothetical protein